MDIHCPNCGEPWDAHHLRYDEPHDWDLLSWMVDEFIREGSRFHEGDDMVRLAAEKAGWRFASRSVLSITRCPACKDHGAALPDADERRALVAGMADLLDGDEDGLASELADLNKAGDHVLVESYGAERPGVITRTTRNGIVFIACLGADGQQTERWAHVHSLRHDDAPGSADNRPDVAKS